MNVVMTAAHGGYDSERTPLGGAAAICERLCRAWTGRVTLLGSGPIAPSGVKYTQVDVLGGRAPSSLGELEYARFCGSFQEAITERILAMRPTPVVLSHDISEGPDFARLSRAGIRCLTLFHVDVVDYFNRFYLGDVLPPQWLTRAYTQLGDWLPVPHVLRLVFEKQQQAVRHCPFVVVPSERMRAILARCYPDLPPGRVQVIGWGSPVEAPPAVASGALWGLPADAPLLLTLSRISPEKSQETLLEALRWGEEAGQVPPGLTLAIAGEAAYMRGQQYLRKLRRLAGRLRRVQVLFPGHLGGAEKWAALRRADLFVVNSRHESYGLTTMEAMAVGCPVVGVRSYGIEETVDSSCGVIVEPGAGLPARLWAELRQLLEAPARRQRLHEGALRKAGAHGFEEAAGKIESLLRAL